MPFIYGNLRRADKIKQGELVEYTNLDNGRKVVASVATVDVIESINPKFPNNVHIQVDHPDNGRIAWGLCCKNYVQIIEKERILPKFNKFAPVKPKLTLRKKKRD